MPAGDSPAGTDLQSHQREWAGPPPGVPIRSFLAGKNPRDRQREEQKGSRGTRGGGGLEGAGLGEVNGEFLKSGNSVSEIAIALQGL